MALVGSQSDGEANVGPRERGTVAGARLWRVAPPLMFMAVAAGPFRRTQMYGVGSQSGSPT
jgi:hypothetical protein